MTSHRRLTRVYDKWANNYDLLYGPLLAHGRKMAMNAMKINSEMKVLEVGIGTGSSLSQYPKNANITGIDISKAMLEKAQKKANDLKLMNINLHEMRAENLSFKKNHFDRVFAPSVLSVVPDPQKSFSEMVRVCKPGGLICIVSHFAGDTWYNQFIDKITDRWAQKFLGYRSTTPKDIVENNKSLSLLKKKEVFFLNFSTLYLLKKK